MLNYFNDKAATEKKNPSAMTREEYISYLDEKAKTDEQDEVSDDMFNTPQCGGGRDDWCFYLPFPFFCMGCCILQSSHLIFNESAKTLSATTWTGHLHLFGDCRKTHRLIGKFNRHK